MDLRARASTPGVKRDDTPNSRATSTTLKSASSRRKTPGPKRKYVRKTNRAKTITAFERKGGDGDEEVWVPTRLVVCLKFSGKRVGDVRRILEREPKGGQTRGEGVDGEVLPRSTTIADVASVYTSDGEPEPAADVSASDGELDAPQNTEDVSSARASGDAGSDSERSVRLRAPFERQWVDETRPFNMAQVRKTLRVPGKELPPLSDLYNWFPAAVPIDAILPPGIPLSAKELLAFYPHHIRWKDIQLRLLNNGYRALETLGMQAFFRGKDKHPLTMTNISNFIRDSLKADIPGFKLTEYKGKPDRDLHTDGMTPGKIAHEHMIRNGFVVPSFDDLVGGLVYLPVGLDARGLTQCVVWYLNMRDAFTPRLELNVLHTQALIRALRIPLKSYGPQNLHMNALQEWRENGTLAKRRVEDEARWTGGACGEAQEVTRSRVRIDRKRESVGVDVVVRVGHVLTFPFLSINSMVCKALEMGIRKAEARKAAREASSEESTSPPTEAQVTTPSAPQEAEAAATPLPQHGTKSPETKTSPSMPTGYKIPKKRPLPEDSDVHARKKPALTGEGEGIPGAPRAPAAMSPPSQHHASIPPRPLMTVDARRGALTNVDHNGPRGVPFDARRSATAGYRGGPDSHRVSPYTGTFPHNQRDGYQGGDAWSHSEGRGYHGGNW